MVVNLTRLAVRHEVRDMSVHVRVHQGLDSIEDSLLRDSSEALPSSKN